MVEDTKEEMDKYGQVKRLEVIRPPAGSPPTMQVYLIVQYDALHSSAKVRAQRTPPRLRNATGVEGRLLTRRGSLCAALAGIRLAAGPHV